MKKIIFIIIMMLFVPTVYAYDYGIENFYINAQLENNGDLIVEEYFNLNGSFNGFERIIKYKNNSASSFNPNSSSYGGSTIHNGSGIKILKVASVNIDDNYNFDGQFSKVFSAVSHAEKGDYGVYTEEKKFDGTNVKIFLPSKKRKAFYIKYKLEDMAILHDDVGELGWNILGKQLNESINHLRLNLTIKDNSNLIKVWGHGPLNGVTKITSYNSISLSIDSLSNNTAVDVRLAFDSDAILHSSKKTNVAALDRIIAYETKLAEEANRERSWHDEGIKSHIDDMFNDLDNNPNRQLYDDILAETTNIYDEELKEKLVNQLKSYEPIIDKIEYQSFKDIISKKTSVTYKDYLDALNHCANVFDKKTKNIMYNNLKSLKRKVLKNELKNDLSTCELVLMLMLWSYGYKAFLKKLSLRKKYYNQINYIRELPSDLSPSAAGLLIDNRLSKDEIASTILDLIRKKVITFEKKEDGSYDLICHYCNEDKRSLNGLSDTEESFISLIFHRSKTINTKHMPRIDYESYKDWKENVVHELENKDLVSKYYEQENVKLSQFVLGILLTVLGLVNVRRWGLFGLLLLAVGVFSIFNFLYKRYQERLILWFNYPILIILMAYNVFELHYLHITFILAVIAMITTHKILFMVPNRIKMKKTKLGKQEMVKWNAFKSFLLDFSRIDLRDINEIVLWEEYLIYATALGISKNVIDKMKMKIESLNIDNEMFTDYLLFSSLSDIDIIDSSFAHVSNSVSQASIPKINLPDSSSSFGDWSSGGGDGGGFSSGGGSFGGGGGGGRF